MKELYLPETQNDNVFTFVGNVDTLIIVGVIVAVITFIVCMILEERKGDKK